LLDQRVEDDNMLALMVMFISGLIHIDVTHPWKAKEVRIAV
jgi:hypothetical protein